MKPHQKMTCALITLYIADSVCVCVTGWYSVIIIVGSFPLKSWWRHQMETFSALLAICAGNSQVTGEFPAQRPVTWSFDVFFDLHPNNGLSKQSWGWRFETQLLHYDVTVMVRYILKRSIMIHFVCYIIFILSFTGECPILISYMAGHWTAEF